MLFIDWLGIELIAHDLYVVWVAGRADNIPKPARTGAGTGIQLRVPLLISIDIEHTITTEVRIDAFLSLSHHSIFSVLLIKALTIDEL